MRTCDKCGGIGTVEIASEGAHRESVCANCGHQSWIHFVYDSSMELLTAPRPLFRLTGRWIIKPAARQVADVKANFAMLKDVGFSELWRRGISHAEIELGHFNQAQISELRPILERSGMETTITLIDLG